MPRPPQDEVARLYVTGYTLREIASHYHCGCLAVMDALDLAGVKRRKAGPAVGFRTRGLPPLTPPRLAGTELERLRRKVGLS